MPREATEIPTPRRADDGRQAREAIRARGRLRGDPSVPAQRPACHSAAGQTVTRPYHRPTLFGPAAMDTRPGGTDPADTHAAAFATARTLVNRGRANSDAAALRRLIEITDTHGLDLLAELWADAPADSLPGALWRVYLLRAWVHEDPELISREFDRGRTITPVHEAVAGVGEPPEPAQLALMVDEILRGVYTGDFDTALQRAAAFARVVAAGRALGPDDDHAEAISAARLLRLAENLESTAAGCRRGDLDLG